MEKFDFLLGNWELKYRVPESKFSPADRGTGTGRFKRALNDRFVFFDNSGQVTAGKFAAHGIFGWDEELQKYRYWWFEDSGTFMSAVCNFVKSKLSLVIDCLTCCCQYLLTRPGNRRKP